MTQDRQSQHDYFRALLLTVMGQALAAAGYQLRRAPMQWAGGKFRFAKSFAGGGSAFIDFQTLVASDTAWSSGMPSRFRVQLTRAAGGDAITRSLSQLVVADFGVKILPAADHWWRYQDTDSLANGLAEAGHLIVGYGIPWLAGELEAARK